MSEELLILGIFLGWILGQWAAYLLIRRGRR